VRGEHGCKWEKFFLTSGSMLMFSIFKKESQINNAGKEKEPKTESKLTQVG
jgi:hypothetical protein